MYTCAQQSVCVCGVCDDDDGGDVVSMLERARRNSLRVVGGWCVRRCSVFGGCLRVLRDAVLSAVGASVRVCVC